MISVSDALKFIDNVSIHHKTIRVNLTSSLNKILAEDIVSPINMPPFRQSAMDGYAIKFSNQSTFQLIDESKAGDAIKTKLKDGETVRIFTGAMVPEGADTVVIQEHVERKNTTITIQKQPKPNANVRPIGEQVSQGELVLKKGQKLTEATIGFLAGLGINEVEVYTLPKISILVTGNELQEAGKPLELGKIYESNAIMLEAALRNIGISEIKIFKTKDTLQETKKTIEKALNFCDVLLISGGISVGDYDFVKASLEANDVEEIFYKVWQKPGKPLWFGKTKHQFVYGLPGNPASALTSFYVYVRPLLKNISGYTNTHLKRVKAKLTENFTNHHGKGLYLKSQIHDDGTVDILHGQQSSMLHSFASSNALVFIPADVVTVNKGDLVECIKLESCK